MKGGVIAYQGIVRHVFDGRLQDPLRIEPPAFHTVQAALLSKHRHEGRI